MKAPELTRRGARVSELSQRLQRESRAISLTQLQLILLLDDRVDRTYMLLERHQVAVVSEQNVILDLAGSPRSTSVENSTRKCAARIKMSDYKSVAVRAVGC